jgi:hypothetical protein
VLIANSYIIIAVSRFQVVGVHALTVRLNILVDFPGSRKVLGRLELAGRGLWHCGDIALAFEWMTRQRHLALFLHLR